MDCISNPACNGATAQQHANTAQNAAQEAINNAGDAAVNLGTSVPGTSATGPIPTSIPDAAVGGIVDAIVY